MNDCYLEIHVKGYALPVASCSVPVQSFGHLHEYL